MVTVVSQVSAQGCSIVHDLVPHGSFPHRYTLDSWYTFTHLRYGRSYLNINVAWRFLAASLSFFKGSANFLTIQELLALNHLNYLALAPQLESHCRYPLPPQLFDHQILRRKIFCLISIIGLISWVDSFVWQPLIDTFVAESLPSDCGQYLSRFPTELRVQYHSLQSTLASLESIQNSNCLLNCLFQLVQLSRGSKQDDASHSNLWLWIPFFFSLEICSCHWSLTVCI